MPNYKKWATRQNDDGKMEQVIIGWLVMEMKVWRYDFKTTVFIQIITEQFHRYLLINTRIESLVLFDILNIESITSSSNMSSNTFIQWKSDFLLGLNTVLMVITIYCNIKYPALIGWKLNLLSHVNTWHKVVCSCCPLGTKMLCQHWQVSVLDSSSEQSECPCLSCLEILTWQMIV